MAASRKVYGRVRHAFEIEVARGDGTTRREVLMVPVIMATAPVSLTLTEAHVQRAITMNGVGTTSRCAMAICVYGHKVRFPHPVEGHVDWQYTRAYVVSKIENGLPAECVAYEHSTEVPELFDSIAGLKKLLTRIQKYGSITVNIRPYRKRSAPGRPSGSRPNPGEGKRPRGKGAKLRRYVASLGGSSPTPAKA